MESEPIIRFSLNAPSKSGCYVKNVVIDNDTSTPARLKEEKGGKEQGPPPKTSRQHSLFRRPLPSEAHMARKVLQDYKCVKKKSMLTNGHAKKMGIDIGQWLYQAKSKNLQEIQELADVPLRHWCGDHSKCNDLWCISKKIATEGKVDNQKLLFYMSYELYRVTV